MKNTIAALAEGIVGGARQLRQDLGRLADADTMHAARAAVQLGRAEAALAKARVALAAALAEQGGKE